MSKPLCFPVSDKPEAVEKDCWHLLRAVQSVCPACPQPDGLSLDPVGVRGWGEHAESTNSAAMCLEAQVCWGRRWHMPEAAFACMNLIFVVFLTQGYQRNKD